MHRILLAATGIVLALCSTAHGQWISHDVLDHLRGKIGIGAKVEGYLEDRTNGMKRGELVVNCSQNSTTVYVGGRPFYFGGESVRVEYAVGAGAVQTAHWNVCAASDCVGLWHGTGIPFARSLFDKGSLKLTLHRRFSDPVLAQFSIAGAREALSPIAQLCGWK